MKTKIGEMLKRLADDYAYAWSHCDEVFNREGPQDRARLKAGAKLEEARKKLHEAIDTALQQEFQP